jgi:predicted TIM-barrel fold metal-dependent hydrolase
MVTRRDFAKSVIGAGLATAMQGEQSAHAQTAAPARRRVIVDAQVHVYNAETPEVRWDPEATRPPLPEFPAERLLPLMDEAGVDRVIIVPPQVMRDNNDYAIEVARRYPGRFAVMGLFPVANPKGADRLTSWRQQPGMLGVRATFVNDHEKKVLAEGAADWFWPAAEKAGVPVMFQAPGNLSRFAAIAERHPALPLIDDHIGMASYIPIEQSATDSIALARYPNVSVKMKAGAQFAPEPYPYRNMNVQLRRVFDAFGPRRCHWETDLTKTFDNGGYRQRIAHFTQALDFLSEDDKDWIMGRAILERLRWA